MGTNEHQTWEYRKTGMLSEADLNELGGEGWELTGATGGELYFKRPRLSFRERVTLEQKQRYYALWNSSPAEELELP